MECTKCGNIFNYSEEDIRWDENGMGYSAKLVTCPFCGKITVVKYITDKGLDVNNDKRWYKL